MRGARPSGPVTQSEHVAKESVCRSCRQPGGTAVDLKGSTRAKSSNIPKIKQTPLPCNTFLYINHFKIILLHSHLQHLLCILKFRARQDLREPIALLRLGWLVAYLSIVLLVAVLVSLSAKTSCATPKDERSCRRRCRNAAE